MTPNDPKALRGAFGRFMTGVTVVTACAPDGSPVGFTANSFTSVSLDPPLLLVCPGRHLSSFDVFANTDHFAVSILAEGQEVISNIFAAGAGDRFAQTDLSRDANNCALITGRVAGFSCRVTQRVEAGDHMVLIGEVSQFDSSDRPALGYSNGGYFSLGNERQAEAPATASRQTVASVILVHNGDILLTANGRLPYVQLDDHTGARSALSAHLLGLGLNVEMGQVYSVYDSANGSVHNVILCAQLAALPENTPYHRVPITEFEADPVKTDIQSLILRRFAQESRTQSFGLYLGNAERGEVH